MKKQVLVFINKKPGHENRLLSLLNEFGGREDVKYSVSYFDNIIININKSDIKILIGGVDILEYDLVYFRSWKSYQPIATAIAYYLQKHKVNFIDKAVVAPKHGNKILQMIALALNDLPVPKTMIISDIKRDKLQVDSNLINFIEYPFVLKSASARRGNQNYLVKNSEEFNQLIHTRIDDSVFLIQEMIPNDFDYRLLVLGDKVRIAEIRRRIDDSSHLNNISKGATEEFIEPNSIVSLCDIAVKATNLFGRQVAGVDIIVSKSDSNPYILEVNPSPGFTYDKSLSNELSELHNYLKTLI